MDADYQGPNPVDERELDVLDQMDVVPWGMFIPTHKINRRYIDQGIVCGQDARHSRLNKPAILGRMPFFR